MLEPRMIEKEKSTLACSAESMEVKELHTCKNPNESTNTVREPKNSLAEHVGFLFMQAFQRMFFIKEM